MLLSYLQSLGADLHLSEDLAQETFLAAYKVIANFDTEKKFSSWLRGIAKNKALMHWRACSSRPPLSSDSRSIEGIDEIYNEFDQQNGISDPWNDKMAIMKQCIAKLNLNLKKAINQVYIHGDNIQEAAINLKASPPAIAKRLSRARNQIRQCVKIEMNNNPHS